jgi:hypothetical protein
MAKECHYNRTDLGNEPCQLCRRVFTEFKELMYHLSEHLVYISCYCLQNFGQQHEEQSQRQRQRTRQQNPKQVSRPFLPKKAAISASSLLNNEQQEPEVK